MAAPATGIYGQLGYAAESTYGTAVTVTRFQEYLEESFKLEIARLEAAGVRTGVRVLRTDRWSSGRKHVSGSISQELHNKSFGLLLKHALGGLATSQPDAGGNPTVYDHTITPGALDALSLTFEVGWKDILGNGFKKTVEGAQCVGWEIGAKLDEFAIVKTDWIGEDMSDTTGVTSASYPSSTTPLTFVNGSLTIAGSAVSVEEFRVMGKNALDQDRYFLGSQLRSQAPENGYRELTGDLVAEFADWTAYDRFKNGTEAALVALLRGALISGTYYHDTQLTMNVRFDGESPVVDQARGRIKQRLPFKAIATSDTASTALSLLYRTTDSTP